MALIENNANIITSRVLLEGVATYAFLDYGTTHSFISESFVKRLGIFPMDVELGFRVTVPFDKRMVSTIMIKDVELKLQRNAFRADLIVLPMPEFDIILGMDWLTLNGATMDFQWRSVSIRLPNDKAFIFEAARNNQMPQIISCILAKKLIWRGCQGFHASIIYVPNTDNRSVEDVEIVKEFPNVFSDDVSGIPPEREVEFVIKLMSCTVPISEAPYCLSRTEMKELKDQIQELLDKGFIRPCFFPRGASVLLVKKMMGA
ncbi:uncharacterized protein [Primulina huaijiensis]|uniref:uncharacterized protein n=1 Tax=Primulina huaijiensis TaxID=1492673 RepID=UPI003CC6E4D8